MTPLLNVQNPDLRYPIGKFVLPKAVSAAERIAAIETLASLPRQLAAALDGLSDAQLDMPYRPGGWSLRQLVHHIADSDLTAYCWMRLAITEDWPTVYDYNPAALAELPDLELAPAVSLQLLEGQHLRWVSTLRGVAESDWTTRGYVHPEIGRCSLDTALAMYDWHSRHHLAQIVDCRRREGWC
jgi:hypothetical protein